MFHTSCWPQIVEDQSNTYTIIEEPTQAGVFFLLKFDWGLILNVIDFAVLRLTHFYVQQYHSLRHQSHIRLQHLLL